MHVSECLHVSRNHVPQFFLMITNKKRNLHTFADIAKGTALEKIQRKETLLELELLVAFFRLNERPDFWSLSQIVYIIFHT